MPAPSSLDGMNAALVKRIEALEQIFRAANDNDAVPVLMKGSGVNARK